MPHSDPLSNQQRQIVNKRLTLNMLIQGAAVHGHWAAHRFAKQELDAIEPLLFLVYDEMLMRSRLGYWLGGIPALMGNPNKFWWKIRQDGHEFGFHPFLVKHGFKIAQQTKRDVFERCRLAGIAIDGLFNEMHGYQVYADVIEAESTHLEPLEELAKDVCCEMYGIGRDLLDGKLTQTPHFGNVREPESDAGRELLKVMIGWSAVERHGDKLNVRATATFWPMLVHELIKGSVELICLHGMNSVSESDFAIALEHTDHVEFEIPMLQIGGTIFKQFLLARPREIALAETIMYVSKFEPEVLEQFMFHLFESPNQATSMIRSAAR